MVALPLLFLHLHSVRVRGSILWADGTGRDGPAPALPSPCALPWPAGRDRPVDRYDPVFEEAGRVRSHQLVELLMIFPKVELGLAVASLVLPPAPGPLSRLLRYLRGHNRVRSQTMLVSVLTTR